MFNLHKTHFWTPTFSEISGNPNILEKFKYSRESQTFSGIQKVSRSRPDPQKPVSMILFGYALSWWSGLQGSWNVNIPRIDLGHGENPRNAKSLISKLILLMFFCGAEVLRVVLE